MLHLFTMHLCSGRRAPVVLCLLTVLFFGPSVDRSESQTPTVFDHLTFRDGLINSSVSSILQDEAGFLWFGTQGGLQRYDGYGMRLYTAEPFNTNSLSNQLVQTTYLGSDNVIWVGTYGGLNRLDMVTGNVRSFVHDPDDPSTLSNNVVTSIRHDGEGTLWTATLNGLNRMDGDEENRFTRFTADPDDVRALPHDTVRALFRDSRDRFWVGSLGGLSQLITHPDRSVEFRTWNDRNGDALVSPFVMTITEDASGNLWIGSWDGGLSRFDPETEQFRHFDLPDNRVYTVLVASTGLVYAGTWGGGMYVLDPDTEAITEYRYDPDVTGSLAHDVVYSLFEDRSGIIWIGTNGAGINTFDVARTDFRYLHRELPPEQRLDAGKVQVLLKHPASGELYVGQQNTGLSVVDPETGRVTRYRHDPNDPDSISSDTINAILPEPDGSVLVSTHAGINRFHPPNPGEGLQRGRFTRVTDPEIPDPIVYPLLRDQDGRLWVGTYSSGVFRRDQDGSVQHYANDPEDPHSLANNLVYDLFEDRYGTIWIATNGGLHRYAENRDNFDRFGYDPSDRTGISASSTGNIYEDSSGTLWIGTRSGGLNRFDRDTETFRHYTVQQGLTSNTITAMHEATPGVLYVGTPNGLNVIHTRDDRIVQIDERDGLHVREFATGVARDDEGNLLFGAFAEVIRVAPSPRARSGAPPATVITGVHVHNEPIDMPVEYARLPELDLTYEENFIAFTFSSLSYAVPARNTYRYRLVGFDNAWIDAGTHRTATYTNLPPGTFEFQVLGTDANGVGSLAPARMVVRISPPFWRTPIFIAGIVVLIIGIVAGVYIIRLRSLQRINRRLEEVVTERTARLTEANQMKDRFFSIIAHDLRGPVAGMESLIRSAVTDHRSYSADVLHEVFSTLQSTASALMGMLENLLEWARIQSGKMEYSPQVISTADILRNVAATNRGAAHAKGVNLQEDYSAGVYAVADLNMLRVVVQNLVNNAIKFTPADGTVTLGTHRSESGESVHIVIRDTGVGIPQEKISEMYRVDTRYRTTGTAGERGSGFGFSLCSDLVKRHNGTISVSSVPGEGTTVTVTLEAAGTDR